LGVGLFFADRFSPSENYLGKCERAAARQMCRTIRGSDNVVSRTCFSEVAWVFCCERFLVVDISRGTICG